MKKQQVFYIHGGDAFSDYDAYLKYLEAMEIQDLPWSEESPKRWSHSLREDLGEKYEVFAPTMPNKMHARYAEWKLWFEKHFEYLKDDIILIGWSLGGMFLAKYLVENDTPFKIRGLILLAGVYGDGTLVDEDGDDGGDFNFAVEALAKIAEKTDKIVIMHSKDDFVVPFEHALKYKEALPEATLVTFEDKNHFLIEEFPELVEMIRKIAGE